METPGMMLKREREARGLTIKYFAAETKISESSLIAIENNDFDAFPAEVFVRGFLRNYARALSLSSDEVIAAYESLKNQSVQHVKPVVEDVRDSVREAVAANTDEEVSESHEAHNFRFAYLVVVLIAIASISLSVVFTGTGEASENEGYYPEETQDVEESPFLISNTSEGWIIQ